MSGWKPGWYQAEVQVLMIALDEISVVYITEPDSVYSLEATMYLSEGKTKLHKNVK